MKTAKYMIGFVISLVLATVLIPYYLEDIQLNLILALIIGIAFQLYADWFCDFGVVVD